MNQITNLLLLLLLISFITPITAITHAQDNQASDGSLYPSIPPTETPNRDGPTENTTSTSDVASNSTGSTQ